MEEVKKKEKSIKKTILENLIYLIVLFGSVFLINTFVMLRTEVSGISMSPTLSDGENLIVDKLSYRFSDPKRFDVVVFKYLYQDNRYYIKRIIGLPGETVQIEIVYNDDKEVVGNNIYIDGEILEENYGSELMTNAKRAAQSITLGENEYFVLGDNRNYSSDSRDSDVGNVNLSQIVGKTFIRIWPLNKFGVLEHQ